MFARPFVESSRHRLALLVLIICAPLLARGERLPIRTYSVTDGLAHNDVNKIVRDSRGFLWFCTADGLSRFDGYTFTNFGTDQGLPHANVTDLLETRSGEYWVATYGGVVRFNPKGTPANHVVYAGDPTTIAPMFTVAVTEEQDRRARSITALLEDRNGAIWCGTLNGLAQLDQTNARLALRSIDIGIPNDFHEQRAISDLLQDQNGSLWIAAPSGLYRRWPDGSTAHYRKRDGLPNEYLSDLFEDHERNLWAASLLGGFFRFNADSSHAPPSFAPAYTVRDGLPTNWVFQLFETADRRFWVATSKGLVEFLPGGDELGHFRSYAERNGLTYHDITALNEDLSGNLWLGTNTTGAMKLARQGFTTYDVEDGIDQINAVFQGRGGVACVRGWILGDGRRSVFEGARFDVLHSEVGEHVQRLGSFNGHAFEWLMPRALMKVDFGWVGEGITLQDDHGEWWIGTGAGLYRFPATDDLAKISNAVPSSVYDKKNGLENGQIFRLFEDSRSDIWVSTVGHVNSLARWERATTSLHDLSNAPALPSPGDDVARSFGEDRGGNVWIGFNTGLARYRAGVFTFFGANQGLPGGGIQQIHSDRIGRLWLASTRSGLIRIDDPQSELPHFVDITTTEGLSSNLTSVITEDKMGNIYVGTGRGLDVLNPVTGRIRHFTAADGLVSGSLLAAFEDNMGTLWFGGSKGVSRFTPRAEEPRPAPPVLITRLSVSGTTQRISALGETQVSLPEFAASQNQMQIDFVGLSFVPGEVLGYQYQLEGADTDWSAPSEQRRVNFANLAPGRYRLLVRAVASDGTVSTVPASVAFRILRPVWQRWWFLVLALMAVGTTIYFLYRYRMARLLEMANVRTRMATDLHDDIGSGLSRMAILSEVVKQQMGENTRQATPLLTEIADSARVLVDSMRDIVWSIDPRRDDLANLVSRVRQFASDVLEPQKVKLDFQAPPNLETIKLNPEQRRHLFLICKEAINNIARHAECGSVLLSIAVSHKRLIMKIHDDGRGFSEVAPAARNGDNGGHGLGNLKSRATQLGGQLTIDSAPGNGTRLLLNVPIKSR